MESWIEIYMDFLDYKKVYVSKSKLIVYIGSNYNNVWRHNKQKLYSIIS